MNIIRYKGRDVVVYKGQPFYRSTGRNSGQPGVWFPFYGWVPPGTMTPYGHAGSDGWFVKARSGRHGRTGSRRLSEASGDIGALGLPEGIEVEDGEAVNAFLRAEGFAV